MDVTIQTLILVHETFMSKRRACYQPLGLAVHCCGCMDFADPLDSHGALIRKRFLLLQDKSYP